ncbi:MAG: ATP-binding cassette domain-containing protein [Oscillospiraceae bacterium]|nr:ATP-binding cassette domain-containing protein [Oscillospiraceae bacterium]
MLELQNICFSAPSDEGRRLILDNVSLQIDEGFTAITGPNGSGKSTLARIIMGMVTPDSGRILFNGEDITDMGITERAQRGIAFAFQQPVRFKGLTVRDLISLAAGRNMSVSETCESLSEVGLCARDYVDREVDTTLSGGELKRIEIAMTIARGAALTLFDEPEAGIDLWSFSSLIKVFERMRERCGGKLIVISHQERILDIADRIIVIADGKVSRDGSAQALLPELLSGAVACEKLQ